MSEEDIKILENIKDYMQDCINKGYHKFIYNDLGHDEKCIDVINAIETLIAENKELKEENKELEEEDVKIRAKFILQLDNYIPKSKVEELIKKIKKYVEAAEICIEEKIIIADSDSLNYGRKEAHRVDLKLLQSLLGKE